MPLKSMVMEFGAGVDIRGGDSTKAAVRAVEAALRHNSITFAQALDRPKEDMVVKINIGVANPETVDRAAVAALLPYGAAEVHIEEGGMVIARDDGTGGATLANAALTVYLDVPEGSVK